MNLFLKSPVFDFQTHKGRFALVKIFLDNTKWLSRASL